MSDEGTPPLLAAIPPGGQGDRRERYMTDIEAASRPPGEDEHVGLEVVTALLECGAALDSVDKSGNTVLHLAAVKGYDSVVRFLASRGIDLNVRNGRGLTPLGAVMARRRGGPTASAGNAAEPGSAPNPATN